MDAPNRRPWLPLLAALLSGALAGPALAAALHWGVILGTLNSATVLPGHLYRSAQPDARGLAWLVRRHGIRTVINLRGHAAESPWYVNEAVAGAELGLSQEDVLMSASRLPSPQAVRQLIEALDHSPRPILIHCQQGVDRTGLAAVSALLLYSDTPLAEATRSMSLASGHVPLGRTRFIGRFFVLYREWLEEIGLDHEPALFRLWATSRYAPDSTPAEWLMPSSLSVAADVPVVVHASCRNLSRQQWRFKADTRLGEHAWWRLLAADGTLLASGFTGLHEAVVSPGEVAGIDIPLPRLHRGQRYRLMCELVTARQATFTQLGSPPMDIEVTVP